MGGQYEKTAPASAPTSASSQKAGNIRMHLSGSEVHFHDDDNKLKVAVPFAVWFEVCKDFRSPRTLTQDDAPAAVQVYWHYADLQLNTRVEILLDWSTGAARISVSPLPALDQTMKPLVDFITETTR